MRLLPHPQTPTDAVDRLEARVRSDGSALTLAYRLEGRLERIAVPAPATPGRKDELWRRTCFEAFVRPAGGEAYCEFNFSPSSEWAAYGFTGYRQGMALLELESPPAIEIARAEGSLELCADLRLRPVPARLALAAVIEEAGGRLTYWAVAHAPGRPDFHHAAGYVLEIRAPESA